MRKLAGPYGPGNGRAARMAQWLWSLLLVAPWSQQRWQRVGAFFPHVNFQRLRPADAIRISAQLLWLLLVRPRPPQPPAARWRTLLASRLRPLLPVLRKLGAMQAAVAAPMQRGLAGMEQKSIAWAEHALWQLPLVRHCAFGISAGLTLLFVTTPFDNAAQLTFIGVFWALALALRSIKGHVATLLLVLMSVTASSRYLWWRLAYTLNYDQSVDLVWGLLLMGAEIYTWVVLLLGYIQTAWPLRRQPVALPPKLREWPTVDVFIPTYNEPLSVVKPTVYAALGLDWPRDKLRIYLLDDGRREQFRAFAADLGIEYMIRPDNFHAKAGNLNHALKTTSGEFIAIFDCDHIPTRSFLQIGMGWFLREPELALLQTPHHFFSPDPFERNLGAFRSMPNEGELFYGLIQDGNDLWNATFFCGSCAIIKRGPLLEVGGIAVETVTEDAHTALKLQRLGYTSAYLNLPQAAGLATESLSAHIGQRIRWARGMAQIFRLDNPFLGKGLRWTQRICYGNAMLHFMNGGPRLIFLTAPLAFLLFHAYIIYAPALSVLLYVMPHMAHASITNSHIQGAYRHSFWAEVYETVLAWYIVRPTMVALIDPHRGKFNVTAKGGLIEEQYQDWTISLPYLTLIGLNVLGFGAGLARIALGPADEISTNALNLVWTCYNLLILGAAVSVASESKQIRRSHRVRLDLPALLHLPNGKVIRCRTEDFSEGGIALVMPDPACSMELECGAQVTISLWRGDDEFAFPARVAAKTATLLRLRWELTSQDQEIALVQSTFGRADAWVAWAAGRRRDQPLKGLSKVLRVGLQGYVRLAEALLPGRVPGLAALAGLPRWIGTLLPRYAPETLEPAP